MYHVRSTASGVWRTVDVYGRDGMKIDEKTLVVAQEKSRWCVNNQPLDVIPGLTVSFRDPAAAQYFLDNERALLLAVEPETVVAFAEERDALFFISRGVAQAMGSREVEQFYAERQAALERAHAEAEDGEQGADGEDAQAQKRRRGKARGKAA